ncbi:PilZ domain-containing protein [Bacteriovorax sp. Seq25_V]|uniref:PilZ domain-containing protein n=1 Tax=Bacteriovorax sp. Seq25_V TaxID=1201288 RepID=UPI00038A4C74|nr:PilZ domain-containing protein [Bacteriovorax sp. Seq25_V]EQC43371.1 type IV pilus assembly protein PilZ [Bacteriovorax sp. Seq25_V]
MFIGVSKIKFKDEFDRVKIFFILHSFLFILAKILELFTHEFSFISFIGFVAWLVYYRFFYRMLKFLHYSFWTMLFISLAVIFSDMFTSLITYEDISLFYLYLLSFVAIILSAYFVHSPIFYPIVSWWEYDFRYRNDLEARVVIGEEEFTARLVDLRRSAGGLSLFKDLDIGTKIVIKLEDNQFSESLHGEIVSKRRHTLGRPFTYGIKFRFEEEDDRKNFIKLQKFWTFERKSKQKEKFSL